MKKAFITKLLALTVGLFIAGCSDQQPIEPKSEPDLAGKKFVPEGLIITPRHLNKENSAASLTTSPPILWEPDFGTPLYQADDDCDFISFPFTFTFYGVDYNGVWVNSNGNLTFNACNKDYSHPDIPDGGNVVIGPLYGDFNPSGAGDVYYNILGTGNTQRVVITWSGVPEYKGSAPNTFQVHLFKFRSVIAFGYNGLGTDGINWSFSPPSTDANMDVGISSGVGPFINSASGSAIPALDGRNIVYIPRRGSYIEIQGPASTRRLQQMGLLSGEGR